MFKSWDEIVKNCLQGSAKDVATIGCIPAVFSNIVTALLLFVGTFALFLFIFAGFRYMFAAGDPKKLEGARNNLIYGILGLLIVLFSFFIVGLISDVTGVPCVTKFGFGC